VKQGEQIEQDEADWLHAYARRNGSQRRMAPTV
jgi:hypothetical protein